MVMSTELLLLRLRVVLPSTVAAMSPLAGCLHGETSGIRNMNGTNSI